jgi:hypothetical protein
MISLMERYVLDFGRDSAKLAALERNACDAGDKQEQQRIEIEGVANSFAVATLNRLLAEIKPRP